MKQGTKGAGMRFLENEVGSGVSRHHCASGNRSTCVVTFSDCRLYTACPVSSEKLIPVRTIIKSFVLF